VRIPNIQKLSNNLDKQ